MVTLGSQVNAEGRWGEGVGTLSKIKKPGGGRGVGVGKFDKIKRKGLFVNESNFTIK